MLMLRTSIVIFSRIRCPTKYWFAVSAGFCGGGGDKIQNQGRTTAAKFEILQKFGELGNVTTFFHLFELFSRRHDKGGNLLGRFYQRIM